jgi:thiamine-monophosphate kinase
LAASGVSARLDEGAVPVAAAVRALFPEAWIDLAMRGGEDYELLFTAPRQSWPAIEVAARQTGGAVTAIGEIVASGSDAGGMEIVGLDGARRTLPPGAFDHFSEG